VSLGSINVELVCLRHMFNMAIKWDKVQKNPIKEVEFFKELEGKDRILSPEEEIRLIETVTSSKKAQHLEPVIITALATGMRKGEVSGLKWPNVDFVNRIITVEATKNGRIRKIAMSTKLTEVLERVRKLGHGE